MTAVVRFLDSWDPANAVRLPYWEEMMGKNIVFRLEDDKCFIHERPNVRSAWMNMKSNNNPKGMCLVTGMEGTIARLHLPIKRVAGAKVGGARLVSFNAPAFESFGKIQNYNAPLTEEAAFAYTTALNWLLREGSPHKAQISSITVVFWGERETFAENIIAHVLNDRGRGAGDSSETEVQSHDVGLLMDKACGIDQGGSLSGRDTPLHILAISPSSARLSVRFWHTVTESQLIGNLKQHFNDLAIVKSNQKAPDYPSIYRILSETAVKKEIDNIFPLLAGALMRSAFAGSPYPDSLLTSMLMRIRSDQHINTLRAASIKACLVRNYKHMNFGMTLDMNNMNIGYRLGRLFAILERVQEKATGGKGS